MKEEKIDEITPPKCPKCENNDFIGTISSYNGSNETVIIDGIEFVLFVCHNCDQYFVVRSKEITEVFMLEVSEKGKNPHFQAVFISELLAKEARKKYLNDPACNKDLMNATTVSYEVHTDLTILDISRPIAKEGE